MEVSGSMISSLEDLYSSTEMASIISVEVRMPGIKCKRITKSG
tara:strand:+ start:660 stop:788 length:129 start_codon:yes stop_codon:yes gene_type:complete